MKKYNRNPYFNDISSPTLHPRMHGLVLIVEYLNAKYGANICVPIDAYTQELIFFESVDDVRSLNTHLFMLQGFPDDFRQAFILYNPNGHTKFLVYIREGGEDAILYCDSATTTTKYALELLKCTGIPVFSNIESKGRQRDHHSCIVDALVFARDTTARCAQTGQFKLPNLIQRLKARVVREIPGLIETCLPDELLKTAQRESFLQAHQEDLPGRSIYKGQTLTQFRARYQNYLVAKALKYYHIAHIQFYIRQIEAVFGKLPQPERQQFVTDAKKILNQDAHASLHFFALKGLLYYQLNHVQVDVEGTMPYPCAHLHSSSEEAIVYLTENIDDPNIISHMMFFARLDMPRFRQLLTDVFLEDNAKLWFKLFEALYTLHDKRLMGIHDVFKVLHRLQQELWQCEKDTPFKKEAYATFKRKYHELKDAHEMWSDVYLQTQRFILGRINAANITSLKPISDEIKRIQNLWVNLWKDDCYFDFLKNANEKYIASKAGYDKYCETIKQMNAAIDALTVDFGHCKTATTAWTHYTQLRDKLDALAVQPSQFADEKGTEINKSYMHCLARIKNRYQLMSNVVQVQPESVNGPII